MIIHRRNGVLMAGIAIALLMSGCAGDKSTSPVTGKVILADGAPLANARITFDCREKGVSATSYTDEAGTYELKALDGDYRVIVMPPPTEYEPYDEETGGRLTTLPPKSPFDSRYQSYETSGLTYTVAGKGQFDITLN